MDSEQWLNGLFTVHFAQQSPRTYINFFMYLSHHPCAIMLNEVFFVEGIVFG